MYLTVFADLDGFIYFLDFEVIHIIDHVLVQDPEPKLITLHGSILDVYSGLLGFLGPSFEASIEYWRIVCENLSANSISCEDGGLF